MIETEQDNPRQAALRAYAAGLIDGEGCVRINRLRKPGARSVSDHYYVMITIGMVTPAPLFHIKEFFAVGSIREERVPNARSIWRWTCAAQADCKTVLEAIRPWLLVKHEQADLALRFMAGKRRPFRMKEGVGIQETRRREEAHEDMRKLNAVGAAATTK